MLATTATTHTGARYPRIVERNATRPIGFDARACRIPPVLAIPMWSGGCSDRYPNFCVYLQN